MRRGRCHNLLEKNEIIGRVRSVNGINCKCIYLYNLFYRTNWIELGKLKTSSTRTRLNSKLFLHKSMLWVDQFVSWWIEYSTILSCSPLSIPLGSRSYILSYLVSSWLMEEFEYYFPNPSNYYQYLFFSF